MSTECCVTRAVLQRFVVVIIREVPSAEDDCLGYSTPRVLVWVQLAVIKFLENPRWVNSNSLVMSRELLHGCNFTVPLVMTT
jgi:hypothetical protein